MRKNFSLFVVFSVSVILLIFGLFLVYGCGTQPTGNGTPAAPIWTITTVTSEGDVGYSSSLALTSVGTPCIVYEVINPSSDINYTKWNASLATWEFQSVGNGGYYKELALTSSDNPRTAFWETGSAKIKYASSDGGPWSLSDVANSTVPYQHVHIVLNSSDYPIVAFTGKTSTTTVAVVAEWNGGSWDITSVESINVGLMENFALAIKNDIPALALIDVDNADLYYATKEGTSWNLMLVDSNQINYADPVDIAYNPVTGYPAIVYVSGPPVSGPGTIKFAEWNGSSWQFQTISSDRSDRFFSLAFDSSGNPRVCWTRSTALRYAVRSGSSWNVWNVRDASNELQGQDISLAIDANDKSHISFYNLESSANDLCYGYIP